MFQARARKVFRTIPVGAFPGANFGVTLLDNQRWLQQSYYEHGNRCRVCWVFKREAKCRHGAA